MKLKNFSVKCITDDGVVEFNKIEFKSQKYSSGNLILDAKMEDQLVFTIQRKDKKSFELKQIIYDFTLPLRNFGKVIIPDGGRFFMDKMLPRQVWDSTLVSNARNLYNPFFVLANAYEEVDFAFGLLGHIYDMEFNFYSPGRNKKNSLTVAGGIANGKLKWKITKPFAENVELTFGKIKQFKDGIFQSEGDENWFMALRKYGESFRKVQNLKYNKQKEALRPAFCTWRVINSDNMTHEWVVRNAKLAKEAGMKAFIFDDGWYGVGLDGASLKSTMGDWPDSIPGKFPDIRKTLKEVKKIGIAPFLWYCPIAVSPDAKIKPKVEHLLVKVNGETYLNPAKFHTLCVRNPEARKLMVKNLEKLIDYGAEGIKEDLFDYMPEEPCEADHEHDVATTADGLRLVFEQLHNAAIKKNAKIIYSIKNNQANVELGVHGSVIRGGDSPFDENINMLRSIYPAAYAPLIHNDYLAFTNSEEPEKVGILMLKQVTTGVPNFSLNLEKLKKSYRDIIKAWLQLFYDNEDLYMEGDFKPQNSVMDTFQRVNDKKAMISLLYPTAKEFTFVDRDTVIILNATASSTVYVKNAPVNTEWIKEDYDFKLNLKKKKNFKFVSNTIEVPSAGAVILRKV